MIFTFTPFSLEAFMGTSTVRPASVLSLTVLAPHPLPRIFSQLSTPIQTPNPHPPTPPTKKNQPPPFFFPTTPNNPPQTPAPLSPRPPPIGGACHVHFSSLSPLILDSRLCFNVFVSARREYSGHLFTLLIPITLFFSFFCRATQIPTTFGPAPLFA